MQQNNSSLSDQKITPVDNFTSRENSMVRASVNKATKLSTDRRRKHLKSVMLITLFSLSLTGLFIFYRTNKTTKNNTLKQEVTPIPVSITAPDIKTEFTKLLNSGSYQFNDAGTANYQGCEVTFHAAGTVKSGNMYSLLDSNYTNQLNSAICQRQSMLPIFSEVYWIGNDIYYRQYKDKDLTKLVQNDKAALTDNPQKYLSLYLDKIKSLQIVSTNLVEKNIEIVADITSENYSGQLIIFIDNNNKIINKISYSIKTNQNMSLDGVLTFTLPNDIALPSLKTSGVSLLNSLDDLSNYQVVSYEVNTQNYIVYNETDYPNIHVLKGEGAKAVGSDCYLNLPECTTKLTELKNIFAELKNLLANAKPVVCSLENPKSGFQSQIYKDRLQVKILNKNRNPRDTSDYLLVVNFNLAGNMKDSYFTRLKIGNESCYEGNTASTDLDNFSGQLETYVSSLFK